MSKTSARERPTKGTAATSCKQCKHYEEFSAARTSGTCHYWIEQTGEAGLRCTTAEEWTCTKWNPPTEAGNPWPTVIEFDAAAEYYGDEGDATSEATDDYFAGYEVPRDARTLITPEGTSQAGDH